MSGRGHGVPGERCDKIGRDLLAGEQSDELVQFPVQPCPCLALLIAEPPKVMETAPDGVHCRKNTSMPTMVRHAMGTEVVILQMNPVGRDKAP